jgi:hypothetical protein
MRALKQLILVRDGDRARRRTRSANDVRGPESEVPVLELGKRVRRHRDMRSGRAGMGWR